MIEVRIAAAGDLPSILELYASARAFMKASGNPDQWKDSYPPDELVREDIRSGRLVCVFDSDDLIGAAAVIRGKDPTYEYIEDGAWLNDEPYAAIHRVASVGGRGVFKAIADRCKSEYDNIRIDTHEANLPMQRHLVKNGFIRTGRIYLPDGSPRIAYQWTRGD